MLDCQYAGIRDLVRTNLTAYPSVLEEAEELGIDAYRERVRDIVVKPSHLRHTGGLRRDQDPGSVNPEYSAV